MQVLLDLRPAQAAPDGRRGGIHRHVTHLSAALLNHDDVVVHGLVDARGILPDVAGPLALAGRLHGGWASVDREAVQVHHLTSVFDLADSIPELVGTARRSHAARVVTAYDAIPLHQMSAASLAVRRRWDVRAHLLRTADLIVAISEAAAAEVARVPGVRDDRIRVTGTGAPIARPVPRPVVPGLGDSYILYTGGTNDPRKRVADLVEAFGRLPCEVRAAHQLVIASHIADHRRDELERRAEQMGAAEQLLITGWVDDDVLDGLFAHATVLVYPSAHEGFGLPVAEAMAYGVPVIATSDPALSDLHGHPDATVRAGDVDALADAIDRVLSDSELREQLVAWGHRRAASHRWDEVAGRTVAAYREVIGSGPRQVRGGGIRNDPPLLATWSLPTLGTPSHAALALALSGGSAVRIASPVSSALRRSGARAVPISRVNDLLLTEAGPLVCFVDDAAQVSGNVALLRSHPGLAVVWDLDLLLEEDASGLRDLASAAGALVVRDQIDAWRVRQVVGPLAPVLVVQPPLPWPMPQPGHAGLLAATGSLDRGGIRAARPQPLVLLPCPRRFGSVSSITLGRARALAACIEARVEVMGADPSGAPSVHWMGRRGPGRLSLTAEPATAELLAAVSSADAVVVADPFRRSAGEASVDLAVAVARPVVTVVPGPDHPLVTRLSPGHHLGDLVDAVRRTIDGHPGTTVTNPREHREPSLVLSELVDAARRSLDSAGRRIS